jgi:hypothetical protein
MFKILDKFVGTGFSIESNFDEIPTLEDYHPPDGTRLKYRLETEIRNDTVGDFLSLNPIIIPNSWSLEQQVIFSAIKFRIYEGLHDVLLSESLAIEDNFEGSELQNLIYQVNEKKGFEEISIVKINLNLDDGELSTKSFIEINGFKLMQSILTRSIINNKITMKEELYWEKNSIEYRTSWIWRGY